MSLMSESQYSVVAGVPRHAYDTEEAHFQESWTEESEMRHLHRIHPRKIHISCKPEKELSESWNEGTTSALALGVMENTQEVTDCYVAMVLTTLLVK